MGFFGTLRKGLQRLFGGAPPPPERQQAARRQPAGRRAPRSSATRAPARVPKDTELPAGWKVHGLWTQDKGLKVNPDPSASDISAADAIVVSYTDALGTDYRTIHGASSRKQVGDLIRKITLKYSPPR